MARTERVPTRQARQPAAEEAGACSAIYVAPSKKSAAFCGGARRNAIRRARARAPLAQRRHNRQRAVRARWRARSAARFSRRPVRSRLPNAIFK